MNLTDFIFEKKDFLHGDDCEAWIDWFWLNQDYGCHPKHSDFMFVRR